MTTTTAAGLAAAISATGNNNLMDPGGGTDSSLAPPQPTGGEDAPFANIADPPTDVDFLDIDMLVNTAVEKHTGANAAAAAAKDEPMGDKSLSTSSAVGIRPHRSVVTRRRKT